MQLIPRLRAAISLAAALLLAGCGGGGDPSTPVDPAPQPPAGRPSLDPAYRASGHMAAGDVFVHLFEWR
ncbi:MAG TPA: hypothetical protein VF771_09660 [Longimicrobiaceae bacterium]